MYPPSSARGGLRRIIISHKMRGPVKLLRNHGACLFWRNNKKTRGNKLQRGVEMVVLDLL